MLRVDVAKNSIIKTCCKCIRTVYLRLYEVVSFTPILLGNSSGFLDVSRPGIVTSRPWTFERSDEEPGNSWTLPLSFDPI